MTMNTPSYLGETIEYSSLHACRSTLEDPTGIGEARNAVIVASADAVIALAGEGGTLAEIGFAKKFGKPIVALDSWSEIEGLSRADTPADAVALALKLATSKSRRRN